MITISNEDETLKLNAASEHMIMLALRVAAEVFEKDSHDANIADNGRVAEQFRKQAAEARALYNEIDRIT